MGRLIALISLAALAATGIDVPAIGQEAAVPCRLCTAGANDEGSKSAAPVTLRVETSLNFDRIVVGHGGTGTAELHSDGSSRTTGSVSSIGHRSMIGEVQIEGEPNRIVRVSLPRTIVLHGFAGGTIRVESIESNADAVVRLDSQGKQTVRFGGLIRIEGDADGEYRGDLPIDVDYL